MVNRSFCSPPECGLHGIRLTWESYYCKLNQKNWLQYTRNQDMRWFEISCFSFFNFDFNYYHPEYLPDHVPTIGLPCNASCIMLHSFHSIQAWPVRPFEQSCRLHILCCTAHAFRTSNPSEPLLLHLQSQKLFHLIDFSIVTFKS